VFHREDIEGAHIVYNATLLGFARHYGYLPKAVLSAFAPNVTAGLGKERPAYAACKMASTAVARRKWSSRRRLAGTGWLWRVRGRRKARSSS
jgi:hypothetical protein